MEETYSTRLLTFKVIPEAVAEMLRITVGVKLRVYAGGGKNSPRAYQECVVVCHYGSKVGYMGFNGT